MSGWVHAWAYGNGFLKLSVVCMVTQLSRFLSFLGGSLLQNLREISRLCSEKKLFLASTCDEATANGQGPSGKCGKALQAARAAEIDAASHRPTAAQKQQQIAELEERAELAKFRGGDPLVMCRLPFLAAAGWCNRALAREFFWRFRGRTARKRGVLSAAKGKDSCTQMLILVTADVPRGSMSYLKDQPPAHEQARS